MENNLETVEPEKDATYQIIGCVYEAYKTLGPGLLESMYQKALYLELQSVGFDVRREVEITPMYKGSPIGENLRIDLLVNDEIILELKSVDHLTDLHKKQLLTYLRITNKEVGLLINFNESYLKNGIIRIVNNYKKTI